PDAERSPQRSQIAGGVDQTIWPGPERVKRRVVCSLRLTNGLSGIVDVERFAVGAAQRAQIGRRRNQTIGGGAKGMDWNIAENNFRIAHGLADIVDSIGLAARSTQRAQISACGAE